MLSVVDLSYSQGVAYRFVASGVPQQDTTGSGYEARLSSGYD